jgi:abortive infection bacteriophage resistance protein
MSKPAFTYRQQLDLLKARGLVVPDESQALHVLEHHNYYRLSAYRFPFTVPGQPDQFQPGVTFTQLWELYQFDRSLRHLVLEGCKRVEISVRSRLAFEIGHQLGPLSYLENRHFRDPLEHARTLTKLDAEMSRSREEFIRHHKGTLGMPWPPVWVLLEVASFGAVSRLLAGLTPPALRQRVADTYQMDEGTFCSLFHHLSVLRNTAAHHARMWNRHFTFTFQLPRKKPQHLQVNFHDDRTPLGNPKERRIHNSLILLVHLVQTIEPAATWPHRLARHVLSLDPALIPSMGFPPDWKTRPMWQALLAENP